MISIDNLMRKRDDLIEMRQIQDNSQELSHQSQIDYQSGISAKLNQS